MVINIVEEILYRYNISSTLNQHHHDITILPNGNFIAIFDRCFVIGFVNIKYLQCFLILYSSLFSILTHPVANFE